MINFTKICSYNKINLISFEIHSIFKILSGLRFERTALCVREHNILNYMVFYADRIKRFVLYT